MTLRIDATPKQRKRRDIAKQGYFKSQGRWIAGNFATIPVNIAVENDVASWGIVAFGISLCGKAIYNAFQTYKYTTDHDLGRYGIEATDIYNQLTTGGQDMVRDIVRDIYRIEDDPRGINSGIRPRVKEHIQTLNDVLAAEKHAEIKASEVIDPAITAKVWLETHRAPEKPKPVEPPRVKAKKPEASVRMNNELIARKQHELISKQVAAKDIEIERAKAEAAKIKAELEKLQRKVTRLSSQPKVSIENDMYNQQTTYIIETGDGRMIKQTVSDAVKNDLPYSEVQRTKPSRPTGKFGSCHLCRRLITPGANLCRPCSGSPKTYNGGW